jgi:hypothetical protein
LSVKPCPPSCGISISSRLSRISHCPYSGACPKDSLFTIGPSSSQVSAGSNPADPQVLERLVGQLHIPLDRLGDAAVKEELRDNTERAAQSGVFGVPTLAVGDELFWGSDALGFAAAYLDNPGILDEEMRHADTLPIGASRPGAS